MPPFDPNQAAPLQQPANAGINPPAAYNNTVNANPPAPAEHPEDIIIVRNIDVGCDEIQYETVENDRAQTDIIDGQQHPINRMEYNRFTHEIPHANYFEVRWDNKPFRIPPGETRAMPRYLAEHFAKHLADHVLAKREKAENKQGLVNYGPARTAVINEILVSVQDYHNSDTLLSPGEQAQQQFQQLNPSLGQRQPVDNTPAMDIGEVPNTAVGNITDKPPVEVPTIPTAPVVPTQDLPAPPEGQKRTPRTYEQLHAEAVKLGLEVPENATPEQLQQMIDAF